MNNDTVLITGGSEGVGFELAKLFAKEAKQLILVARDEKKLALAKNELGKISSCSVSYYCYDLTRFESVKELYLSVKGDGHNVDILVNNAGIGYAGECIQIDPSLQQKCVLLNDSALVGLCGYFGKDMALRKHGEIINVSSTAAFQPGPYMATYYASKAFVGSYTEALHIELKPYGVLVHSFAFGPLATEFYAKSNQKTPSYAMNCEDAARYCYKKRHSRKVTIIPGFSNRILKYIPKKIKVSFVKRVKGKTYE